MFHKMRERTIQIVLIGLLSICLLLTGIFLAVRSDGESEQAVEDEKYVRTAPFVTADMNTASYWIEKMPDADKEIATPEQIAEINARVLSLAVEKESMFDFQHYGSTISKEKLRKFLGADSLVPDTPRYVDATELTPEYYEALYQYENIDAIGEENAIQYGICVNRTDMRHWTTDDVVMTEPSDYYNDCLQNSSLLMNEPVLIFHWSTDREWAYALSEFACGWVKSSDIAVCSDYQNWIDAQSFQDFLIVTGDKILLEEDPFAADSSGKTLYMGTKLVLVSKEDCPETISERYYMNNYVVKLPIRNSNGLLDYEYMLIPQSRDVNEGYLPYTKANILSLAFKSLGNVYGWGGMLHSRDCSEYTLELFRCFGIHIPRNSVGQGGMDVSSVEFTEDMDSTSRIQTISGLQPGSILMFPGHIMIYLGEENGHLYAISAVGNFAINEEAAVRPRSVLVNDIVTTKRANGKTWLESIEKGLFVQ